MSLVQLEVVYVWCSQMINVVGYMCRVQYQARSCIPPIDSTLFQYKGNTATRVHVLHLVCCVCVIYRKSYKRAAVTHDVSHGAMALKPLALGREQMLLDMDFEAWLSPEYESRICCCCWACFNAFSGLGPRVDMMAVSGIFPIGRCILAAARGSLRSMPCFL